MKQWSLSVEKVPFFLSIHLLTCVYIWVVCPLNFPYSKYLCRVCHLNEPLGYWREWKQVAVNPSVPYWCLPDFWQWRVSLEFPVTLGRLIILLLLALLESESWSGRIFCLSWVHGIYTLALCSFPAPLWHHCLLLFFLFCFVFNGSEKCLCFILYSLQSSFCKSLLAKELWTWVAWCGACGW